MTDEQLRDAFLAGFEAGVEAENERCKMVMENIFRMQVEMFGDAAIQAYEEWTKEKKEE